MVTDQQYKDLLARFEELNQKYTQMSRDLAAIKMRLDLPKTHKRYEAEISRKDITRYYFRGKLLNKRQLVLECVKCYIDDTGNTDPKLLLELFPDYIQGSLGVIRPAQEAEQYSNAREHYFFKDDEVLFLDSGMYVVCKDWTINNIDRFIDVMTGFGYEIKPVNRD